MDRRPLSAAIAALFVFSQPALGFEHWVGEPQSPPWRNQGGTLNYAPRPDVYLVLAVDDYYGVVRLRARSGAEADVHVDERIFDVSALRPGDLVQVDFFARNDEAGRLAAAQIWPLR